MNKKERMRKKYIKKKRNNYKKKFKKTKGEEIQ